MEVSMICVAAGPIISIIVSALKRIPFVKRYPKSVAFFISAVAGTVTSMYGNVGGLSIAELTQCVIVQFSAAVATHEAVTNQLPKIGLGSGDYEKDRV